jgi:hypothetical protein
MKFHDLDIGQRFELDGVAYVKTSPVLAGQAEGGGSKFVPRYVMVRLLDGAAPRARVEQEKMLRAQEVLAAFDVFHARCRDGLAQLSGDIPADKLDAFMRAVEEGRKVFLDTLAQQQ